MKIVILDGYTVVQNDLNWDALHEFGELLYYERTAEEQIIPRIKDADMVITSKCLITKEVIDSCTKLKYIGVIATGYNNVDVEYAKSQGVTITNIPSYSTDSVGQLTFSLLLEIVNRVGLHSESVHRGDWENSIDFSYSLSPQRELAGKTFGIIGYGNTGQKAATLANAFGMKTLVFSSHMSKSDNNNGIEFVDLDELLSRADIVSLHCVLTDKNKELINRDTISKMKDGAILINTARGPLINEEDVADALRQKKLKAVAVDVLTKEPPTEGSPLIEFDNCIITPHIAWTSNEARERLVDIAVGNVKSFLEGNPKNSI